MRTGRQDIFWPLREQFNADRKAGYLLALAEHALPIRPEWILESDGTEERTEELLGQFLSLPEPPSALLASDDLLAVLTMRQVLAKGVRIPEDLSIVSFKWKPRRSFLCGWIIRTCRRTK